MCPEPKPFDESYLATHPQASAGKHVQLSVSDTGQGMSAQVKHRIFEPFFTTKPKGRGTGLGLPTTFGIVKQAGGSIEVYSELGMGTTFKIYLPRVDHRSEVHVETRDSLALQGNETVLLVEDDASVRVITFNMLRHLGYEVLQARSGQEALAMMGQAVRATVIARARTKRGARRLGCGIRTRSTTITPTGPCARATT